MIRANATIEENRGKTQIIVTEIPYMINKSVMLEKTADLINEKKIEGIWPSGMSRTGMDACGV